MRKAFLYDNQGYVTNPFKVRNNTSYAYKWQKTHSRCERLCSEGIFNPLKNVAFPAQLQNKPATAPDKIERVKEFEDSLIKLGPLSPKVFAEDNDSFLQLP